MFPGKPGEGTKPYVITIANQKGGTGKTTLTALLAYGLSLQGYSVLMLDLDPQAHLSSLFLKPQDIENVEDGVIQMAQGSRFKLRKIELGVKGVKSKVALIPSGLNYIVSVFRGTIPSHDPFAIRRRIETEPSIKGFDFVICDTPPELFAPTIWGLYAAHFIIIPSNYEELSLMGIKLLLKDIVPSVIYARQELRILGIALINVTRKLTKKSTDKLNDILLKFVKGLPLSVRERMYHKPLFESVIHRNHELADLIYRPRRWELPIARVIDKTPEIKNEVESFTKEVLDRINNFKSLT